MRKQQRISFLAVLLVMPILPVVFAFFPNGASALSPSSYLGNALNFAVLANTPSVTNTGTTTISGTAGNDVGIAPAASFTGAGSVTMTGGTVHLNDTAAQNAQTALTSALITLNTDTLTATLASELGGKILTAGVYTEASGTFGITGTLTLDGGGNPASIFIFRASSTLVTASSSSVVLTNGALSCNVYWAVGSSATLGTNSIFVGHLLAATSITANTGANIIGQLLARDATVTLDSNVITNNDCATPTPTASSTATATASSTATATATTAPTCTSTIRTLVFTSGGPGSTTGKLTWTTTGPGLFQYVGDPKLYPAPYNYGALTASWDGSLVKMVPEMTYQVAVRFTATCGLVTQASTVVSNAAPVATPTPTPTPMITPTLTPTPTPVITPTPTPSIVVSEMPTLTSSPIPTSTARSSLPAIPELFAPNNDNISITPNTDLSGTALSLRISIVNLNVGQKITVTIRRVK